MIPFVLDAVPPSWMKFSALSLVLIPLCFGYAIIRYRLMDVDIIFKRGLAYTAATAASPAVYFALIALIAEIFHAQTTGPVGGMIAIVIAAFLFQPFREWIQARLDRFFYRDRLDYRRTLIEFGRTLDQRSALRSDARLGDGPHFADAAGRSAGDFHGRPAAARAIAPGALHGRAAFGTHGS